jgi:hypothetical protein
MILPFRNPAAAVWCCSLILMTGCALAPKTIAAPVVAAKPVSQASAADSLLADLARLQSIPPVELA